MENQIDSSETDKKTQLERGINYSITDSEIDSLINFTPRIDEEKSSKKLFIYKFVTFLFIEIFYFLPIFVGVTCYLLSLEKCLKDYDTCLNELDKAKISRLLTIMILSAFFLGLKYFVILHSSINFKTLRFLILTSILGYLTLYFDIGNSFNSHGAYNRLFLFIGIPLTYLIFLLLLGVYLNYKKFGIIVIIIFSLIIILPVYLLNERYYKSCEYWDKGLKNSKINNNISCKLEKPTICNEIIFDNIFDVVFYLNDDCSNRRNDDINIVNEYAKGIKVEKTTHLAYPRVEDWEMTNTCNYYYYRDNVMKELFNMNDPNISQIKKDKNEVYVDFTKNPPDVKINLKKDEELIKSRSKIFEKNLQENKVPAKNILFFFVDSMSRNHFKRKLNKIHNFIERFYEPDEKSKFESFQFLKYHGVGTWTNINLQPFFFGVPYDSSNGIYSLKYFKMRGYITGSTENTCSREFVGLYNGEMSELIWDNYDHDFTSFFCDPNFYSKEKVYSMTDGPYCYRKKCLYGKQTYDYSVEYANQFFETYKDQGKMFRLGNIDAHEGTGESIKYNEAEMIKFLENFEKNGHLDDTIVIFFSDHGYTMPGVHQVLQSEDHIKELLLPFIYILVPKKIKNFEKIKENLKHNENMFMTPYDINNTILGMLNVEKKFYNNLGVDIMNNKLSGTEGCKKFKIKDEWCKCRFE